MNLVLQVLYTMSENQALLEVDLEPLSTHKGFQCTTELTPQGPADPLCPRFRLQLSERDHFLKNKAGMWQMCQLPMSPSAGPDHTWKMLALPGPPPWDLRHGRGLYVVNWGAGAAKAHDAGGYHTLPLYLVLRLVPRGSRDLTWGKAGEILFFLFA